LVTLIIIYIISNMGITFDYFSITLLLGGFTALLSGIVVFIHNHRNIENIAWLLSNLTSAIWSFAYFATITGKTYNEAILSNWILHVAAILIPICYLTSVLAITNSYYTNRIQLIITAFTGCVFLALAPTTLFVRDVIPKASFNFVPDAGPAYIYFTIYFFTLVVYALYIVFKKYRESTDPTERKKFASMILFTIFGFGGGGSVFFLTFNIYIMPYPLILFAIYPAVSGYAIFRYQLFDVKVIATEITVFSLWIFVLIRTLLSTSDFDRLINGGILIFIIGTGILLIRSVIKEVRLREEIEKLAGDLKHSNEGQASLIHFMNHQVKGKFGNARNIFAELLTDDYGVMPESARPLLEKGLEETKKGVDYVQNILKGASAESGNLPYDMQPMNYRTLIEDIISKQKEIAETKGLTFNFQVEDGKYDMLGDALQLSEATRNLIDNSINYTQEGSIEVHLRDDGNAIRLTIHDTGIGLSDDDKTKLFKSGGRGAESVKINVNSTGYGLVFVKGVIQAHKGRVWAESEGRGKGSTFIIELPQKAV